MSTKKQYKFAVKERVDFHGNTWPDYESPTYKSRRKAEQASYDFDCLPGVTCGGSSSIYIWRSR